MFGRHPIKFVYDLPDNVTSESTPFVDNTKIVSILKMPAIKIYLLTRDYILEKPRTLYATLKEYIRTKRQYLSVIKKDRQASILLVNVQILRRSEDPRWGTSGLTRQHSVLLLLGDILRLSLGWVEQWTSQGYCWGR